MLSEDFYGKKSFVWWTGVVEDIYDPLKMGYLRVRIFGIHPKDRNLVPTEKLPWAQILHPVNGVRTASSPRHGDWVFGFFQDGEAAQMPVVMGIFSGVDEIQANVAGKPYVPPPNNNGFFDVRTKAQVDAGPMPPEHIEDRKVGEPSNHRRLPREILDSTGIKSTNAKLSHNCDITQYVDSTMAQTKAFFAKIIQAIRKAFEAISKALGFDKTGSVSYVASEIRNLAVKVNTLQKFAKDIKDFADAISKVIATLKAIIAYVASLPAKLASFLRSCVANVASAVFAGANSLLPSGTGNFNEVLSAASELKNSVGDTYNSLISGVSGAVNGAPMGSIQSLGINNMQELNSAASNIGSLITNQISSAKETAMSSVFVLEPPTPTTP